MTAFVSYSGDRATRVEIVHALREHGVTPWRDVEDLDIGAPTTATIEDELANCSGAILWINNQILASAYVANVELPAIARAARDRKLRIVPVFDGISPSDASERLSRFGIEIGESNGHVVDSSLAPEDTAGAIAARYARAEVRAACQAGRAPVVRFVTYDDTAAHRDDAILNFDWRHRFTGTTLDDATTARLRRAVDSSTRELKASYGSAEITLAVKAQLPIAVAVGHAFAEPTGCTLRMERADDVFAIIRNIATPGALVERPDPAGPVETRRAAVEVSISRDISAGVDAYIGTGRRYRQRIHLTPPTGADRSSLDGPATCNQWAKQIADVLNTLTARNDIDDVDLFLACPVELAVAIGWWSNAAGPMSVMNWTGKAGPYAPMWRLP